MQPYWQSQRKRKTKTKKQNHTNQAKLGGTDSVSPEVVTLNAKRNNDGSNSAENRQRQPGGRDPECSMNATRNFNGTNYAKQTASARRS